MMRLQMRPLPSTYPPGEHTVGGDAADSRCRGGVRADAVTVAGTAAPGAAPREGMPSDRPPRRRRRRRRPPPGAVGATPAPGALGSALPPVDALMGADGDSGVSAPEESASREADGSEVGAGSQRPRALSAAARARPSPASPPAGSASGSCGDLAGRW